MKTTRLEPDGLGVVLSFAKTTSDPLGSLRLSLGASLVAVGLLGAASERDGISDGGGGQPERGIG